MRLVLKLVWLLVHSSLAFPPGNPENLLGIMYFYIFFGGGAGWVYCLVLVTNADTPEMHPRDLVDVGQRYVAYDQK